MMSPARQARLMGRAYELHRNGQLGPAVSIYQKVLQANPRHVVALHQVAVATRQISELAQANGTPFDRDTARHFMEAAVEAASGIFSAMPDQAISPGIARDCAGVIHNYAKFLNDYGDLASREAVIAVYEAALSLSPEQGESWTNLGIAYGDAGNRMRAEAAWTRALACPTPTPEARFNLSMLHLLRGDYERGWAEYEARWDSVTFRTSYGRPDIDAPRWDGSRLEGTLYLHGEQGAGDVLMMARYLPLAAARCRRLIVEVLSNLVPLFRAAFPSIDVVARGEGPPTVDAHLPMMSCPAVFGTTLRTVPEPPSFRTAIGDISPIPGRIGLCWKGSSTHPNDRLRSMPKEEMVLALASVAGAELQSLQFGESADPRLVDCPSGDYLNTARAIAACAFVVTVDTSVAHLAGSLGVPTMLALPINAEWRWLQDRDDSPWYPSVRIVRQPAPGDWSAVMERIRGMLNAALTEVSDHA